VWATDDSIEPVQRSLSFSRRGQLEVVEFGEEVEPEVEPEPEPEPEPPAPVCPPASVIAAPIDAGPKRMLPRWQEVGALVTGAALLAGGSVMLYFDGEPACPDSDNSCDWNWEFTPGAALMFSVGGVVLISSVVMLSLDERRVRAGARRGKQARMRGLGVAF
jgi:hypothetical protein